MATSHSELGAGLDVDAIRLLSYPDATRQITWSGTIVLDRDFRVAADQTLIVVAGTEVQVAGTDALNLGADPARVEILVDGRLLVEADAADPATMHADSPGSAAWAGARLRGGASATIGGLVIRDSEFGLTIDSAASARLADSSLDGLAVGGEATLETPTTISEGELRVLDGGSLKLEADLTIGPNARLMTLAGSRLLVADADAGASGDDPEEVEIDVQGHLIIVGSPGNLAVVQAELPGGDWAGIRHESAAGPEWSAVVHARIDDAKIALDIAGERNLALSQSFFNDNLTAIRLTGRDGDMLYGNTIRGGSTAIRLVDASPTIQDGEYSNAVQGIVCSDGSRPKIRRNDFIGLTTAVQAGDWGSRPNLGTVAEPGYNNFDASNQWNLLLVDPLHDVSAQENYWGSIKPGVIEGKFLIAVEGPENGGRVLYEPFRLSALP